MPPHADPPNPSREKLRATLLEYADAPGKYHVALRQPGLLFASIREILQIAAGREPDAGSGSEQENADVRRAACFFTRTALLAPGADHYALLGLGRNFDAAELKDRYRLLMRLIHPDFSSDGSNPWPADAAVRVNLAHDVLSSAVQRRDYDARLAAAANVASPGAAVEQRRIKSPERTAPRATPRSRLKQLAIVCSLAGGSLVLISLFVAHPDAVQLVQRVKPPAVEPTVSAMREPLAPAKRGADPAPPEPVRNMIVQQPLANDESPATKTTAKAPEPQTAPLPSAAPPPKTHLLALLGPPPAPAPAPAAAMIEAARAPAPAPAAPLAAAIPVPIAAVSPPISAPAPAVAPALPSPTPPPIHVARADPVPPAPPPPLPVPSPRPAPIAGVSLAEAQPLLASLLQQLESGRGERLINLLDRDARNKPGAQALSRQYDVLVEGMQPVRLSHVEFKAEPAEGRLLVTGHIRLHVGEQTIGSMGKKIVVRAEFASRDGTVVMTGLSGVAGN